MSDKIKILHVHTLPVISGSGIHTLDTMRGFKSKGYEVEFACASQPGALIEAVKESGIAFRPLRFLVREINPYKDIRAVFELESLMKREQYHIVHTHNSKAGFIGRLSARLAGIPVVVHTVHGFAFHEFERRLLKGLYVFLERTAAPWSDRLVVVSSPLQEWGLRLGIGDRQQYAVIPDGIDTERYEEVKAIEVERRKQEFCIDEDTLVVGFVAKLWEGKGHAVLIEAIPDIIREVPRVKFMFVGEGYLKKLLERIVKKKGLQENVIFTGFREDIPQITALFDVAVLPSFYEGLGRSLLEAMALSKPVVATSVGGIPFIVRDGENGLLVPANDSSALAFALIRLLKDSSLRRSMGEKGRIQITERFSVKAMVEQVEAIYKDLLKKKGLMV